MLPLPIYRPLQMYLVGMQGGWIFKFDIEHIKGRENVVADSLSRIPGTETLSALFLCSVFYTLGVQHCADVPAKLQKCQ
jgi:hypothetical protein